MIWATYALIALGTVAMSIGRVRNIRWLVVGGVCLLVGCIVTVWAFGLRPSTQVSLIVALTAPALGVAITRIRSRRGLA